jgi:CHAT domain-containing protein/Tfp pilus assembly protein PilF
MREQLPIEIDCVTKAMKMKRLTVLFLTIVFPSYILSQITAPKSTTIARTEWSQRGVVVEEVAKSSAAEKAGLQEGDVLLGWHRGDATGNIESPFDVSSLAIEQGLRGAISLTGARGSEESIWIVEPGSWGLQTRPTLPQTLLLPYLEGRKLAQSGKWTEAAEQWWTAAIHLDDSTPIRVRLWLLSRSADAFVQGHQWQKADEAYQQALQQAGEAFPAIRVLLLRAWANTYKQRSDWPNAEKYYQQSISEKQKSGPESLIIASILDDLGTVSRLRGDLAKAEEYYRRALEIRQKLTPGSLDVAASLNNFGIVARQRGDLAKAEEYLRQALEMRQKLAPKSLDVAASFNNLGNVVAQRGDIAKAEEYYRQALEIRQKLAPRSLDVAATLDSLGIVARKRGDLAKAGEYYRQAQEIRQKLAPGSLDVASGFGNLGNVAKERGDLAKAEEYYRQALQIRQKLAPGSLDVAISLDSLGNVAEQRGDLAKAEDYHRQALEIEQKLAPGSLDVAASVYDLGNLAEQRGDLAKAEDYHRQALEIRQKLAPQSEDYADSLAALAEVLRRKEQMGQAAQLYQQALGVLEKQMTIFGGSEETRSGFRSNHLDFYRAYIDFLVRQKQPELAFHVLERSRAQGLLETLAAARVDIRKGVNLELVEKERSLRELLTGKSNRRIQLLNDKPTEAQAAALDKEIQEILKQYQEVEGQIRQASPGYAALTPPQPLTIKEVQQEFLDKDTVLLEYALGGERSYVFAVTQDSIVAFPLPKRADIDASAREVYRLLASRDVKDASMAKQALVTLSHQVLEPVAGQLNKKRVLVVSDGALQYIPFAVLPAPQDSSVSLLIEHEVVNLPSASVLAVLRRQLSGRKIAPKTVAILADPVFNRHDDRLRIANKNDRSGLPDATEISWQSELDKSAMEVGLAHGNPFPRLVFSRREAHAIYSAARQGDATKSLDFDASKGAAMNSQLQDYRIVHYATHGLLNNEHPELSGLVFSLVDRQGKPQDGFLRLIDIYNLELNADLVVLSACQTALGKQIAEEGLVGLTRGFMYAGAPRVMASLWKVDDEATAELMKKFYEGMLKNGQTPAQALRSSQVWMSQQKRWKEPYYWAGFILQGEWK